MYNASEQFHSAVFQGSPRERILFKFADGTIFTNEDISVRTGVTIAEAVNNEEELTIGSCPASTLDTTIINDHGLLNNYAYGECEVFLGVRIASSSIPQTPNGGPQAVLRYGAGNEVVFRGHATVPYLTIGTTPTTVQPPFGVYAILIVGADVYCISAAGDVWHATWADGSTWNSLAANTWNDLAAETWDDIQGTLTEVGLVTISDFMANKFIGWARKKRGMWYNGNMLYEFTLEGIADTYEYVPLGVFNIKRPTRTRISLVNIDAEDRMTKFDIDAAEFWDSITYPTTLGDIFAELCAYVGVPTSTVSFINSTRTFTQAPGRIENISCREVLRWIAGAACSFARMSREGELELTWFGTEVFEIPMSQYFTIAPAEYEVAPIDKLQIMGAENDIGVIIGEGTNAYQILDNPCLYGTTDTEIRTYGTPIYNRLVNYGAFAPITADAVCDWAVQAGDIVQIIIGDATYLLPIYRQTIKWNAHARVTYECTGSESRPIVSETNRQIFKQNRSIHLIENVVEGFRSEIYYEDEFGEQHSKIEQVNNRIELLVTASPTTGEDEIDAASIIAAINDDESTIKLTADKITLEGVVTANQYFKILADGSMEAKSGKIGGWTINSTGLYSGSNALYPTYVKFGNWYFDDDGFAGPGVELWGDSSVGNLTLRNAQIEGETSGDLNVNGFWVLNNADVVALNRIYMEDPPSASSTANVRLVSSTYGYSLGLISSSRRYKKDIQDIGDMGSVIDNLRPISYKPINEWDLGPYDLLGFIAEEVAEVEPRLVDYRVLNEEVVPESVTYDRVCVVLVAEVKELRKRVALLEGALNHET